MSQKILSFETRFKILPNFNYESYHNVLFDLFCGGGVAGGCALPHFRNFSALIPQIRRQKLAISAILEGYEESLPTAHKTQHKPFSFHFAHDRSDSSILQSSWVIISGEKFCCCCCYCGCCLQICVICIVFACFSAFR